MRLRKFALVGLVASGFLALLATGGFSAANADRSVEVAVAEDENAFLGIPDKVECGQEATVVENQLHTDIDVTVTVSVRGQGELQIKKPTGTTYTQLDSSNEERFTYNSLDPGDEARLELKPPVENVTTAEKLELVAVKATWSEGVTTLEPRTVHVSCGT